MVTYISFSYFSLWNFWQIILLDVNKENYFFLYQDVNRNLCLLVISYWVSQNLIILLLWYWVSQNLRLLLWYWASQNLRLLLWHYLVATCSGTTSRWTSTCSTLPRWWASSTALSWRSRYTVCPRSSDPYIYYLINWVTTSWTHSTCSERNST